jgi:hypothetical protein
MLKHYFHCEESKWKDVERFFGVFEKNHFFSRPIPFAFIEDILNAFYCCIVMHNMCVQERTESSDFIMESELLYNCVEDAELDDNNGEVGTRVNVALQYVATAEERVNERALEVQYLSGLGINIVDSSLASDLQCIAILPQYQQVAQYRWNQLYSGKDHLKLTRATGRELKKNYDEYKRQHCN